MNDRGVVGTLHGDTSILTINKSGIYAHLISAEHKCLIH